MTKLERKVKRKVGEGRDAMVVILHPADGSMKASIELRAKYAKQGFRIELPRLFTRLAMAKAGITIKRKRRSSAA